jgi:hypothetical protein
MCQALQELMKDEIDEKLKESDLKKTAELTKSLMESLNIGLEEAMDKLKLSDNDRKELRNRICVD